MPQTLANQARPGIRIHKGLARRLAAHYGTGVASELARFYWTGEVPAGAWQRLQREYEKPGYDTSRNDSRGRNDPQAVLAETRALIHYLKCCDGQRAVPNWLDSSREEQWHYLNGIVPWAWREKEIRVNPDTDLLAVLQTDDGERIWYVDIEGENVSTVTKEAWLSWDLVEEGR